MFNYIIMWYLMLIYNFMWIKISDMKSQVSLVSCKLLFFVTVINFVIKEIKIYK